MLKSALMTATLCLLVGVVASAETTTASIFAVGETAGKPRFTQATEKSTADGKLIWKSVIKDLAGAVMMTEDVVMKDGVVLSHQIDHLQINERYELAFENKKAVFKTFKLSNGKVEQTDTSVRDIPETFVMGPSTESFLVKHLDELANKKSVKADFGVFELGRFVSFRFSGIANDGEKLEIKMKPANFIVAALVDPIKIILDKSKRRIVYLKGRTPLREMKNGKSKPFDAEIIYH